jgi:hypothetical protein
MQVVGEEEAVYVTPGQTVEFTGSELRLQIGPLVLAHFRSLPEHRIAVTITGGEHHFAKPIFRIVRHGGKRYVEIL